MQWNGRKIAEIVSFCPLFIIIIIEIMTMVREKEMPPLKVSLSTSYELSEEKGRQASGEVLQLFFPFV